MTEDYPGAVPVGEQTVSAVGGGGGSVRILATSDPPDAVVAFLAARHGPPTRSTPERTAWKRTTTELGWRSVRSVEVWRGASAPLPGLEPARIPPGTRAVLVVGSTSMPRGFLRRWRLRRRGRGR